MRKIFATLFAVSALFIGNFAYAADITDDGYIEAEGYGDAQQSVGSGRRAAIMDAYRYLAEQVDDLHISSSTTVKHARTINDEINSSVESILRGAKIVSAFQDKKGGFHAIARLPIYGGQNSLARAVIRDDYQIMEFPELKYKNTESNSINEKYTGLIVDCRGLKLATAISPSILAASGESVYAYQNLQYNIVVDKGMIDYSHQTNSDVQRAGSHPLIIKAIKVADSCNPVVSEEDAAKILSVNKTDNILRNCNVVFVR